MVPCYEHQPEIEPLMKEMKALAAQNYLVQFPANSDIIYVCNTTLTCIKGKIHFRNIVFRNCQQPSEYTLTAYSAVRILAQVSGRLKSSMDE